MSTERERFEAWFLATRKSKHRPDFARLEDGTYAADHTQRHWWTWQAARTQPATPASGLNEEQIELAWRRGFRDAVNAERLNATEEWGYKAANVIQDVQGLVGIYAALATPAQQGELQTVAQLTGPRVIWLQTGDAAEEFPEDHEGVTWAEDEIGDGDVRYIRADLATTPPAQPEPVASVAKYCDECGCIHKPGENTACPTWGRAQPAPVVPSTHKLVPIEPSPAMLVALWDHREAMRGHSENKIARAGYAAMLAAAPQPLPLHNALVTASDPAQRKDDER